MAERVIDWDKEAAESFLAILKYIAEDSPKNATLVSNRIWRKVNTLPEFPKMYRADELKKKNDGNFRVFDIDRIRISYQITPTLIRIIRIRHTSQEPFEY